MSAGGIDGTASENVADNNCFGVTNLLVGAQVLVGPNREIAPRRLTSTPLEHATRNQSVRAKQRPHGALLRQYLRALSTGGGALTRVEYRHALGCAILPFKMPRGISRAARIFRHVGR